MTKVRGAASCCVRGWGPADWTRSEKQRVGCPAHPAGEKEESDEHDSLDGEGFMRLVELHVCS